MFKRLFKTSNIQYKRIQFHNVNNYSFIQFISTINNTIYYAVKFET